VDAPVKVLGGAALAVERHVAVQQSRPGSHRRALVPADPVTTPGGVARILPEGPSHPGERPGRHPSARLLSAPDPSPAHGGLVESKDHGE